MKDNIVHIETDVRIGVVCLAGLDTFLPDIIHKLEEKYNVRNYCGNDMNIVNSIVEWSDIVWVEFANEICLHVTKNCNVDGKKVIVRLHSYEALSGYCHQIDWSKVNNVIFVAQHVFNILKKQNIKFPPNVRTHVVHNGVDTNKFRRLDNE